MAADPHAPTGPTSALDEESTVFWRDPARPDGAVASIADDRLDSAALARLELARAKGALAYLKERVGNDRMRELLADDLRATTDRTTAWARESGGRWQTGVLELVVPGPDAGTFHRWFMAMMREDRQADLRAAHPDHFMNVPLGPRAEVIENVGEDDLPWFIHLEFTGDPARYPDAWNDEYPERLGAVIRNSDGVEIGSAQHEMKDAEDGMHVLLKIHLPAAAPARLVRGHLEHFAVEFTNWTRQARTE